LFQLLYPSPPERPANLPTSDVGRSPCPPRQSYRFSLCP
jgi:hypothetical protein